MRNALLQILCQKHPGVLLDLVSMAGRYCDYCDSDAVEACVIGLGAEAEEDRDAKAKAKAKSGALVGTGVVEEL